jgi:O-antigen ligase/tetratricopeptide (TPR) repeat protein
VAVREDAEGRLGIHAAGLIGAAAVLLFHPGAMDMDRLKWSFLLCITMPLLLGAFGFSRIRAALRVLGKGPLAAAALIPAVLMLSLVLRPAHFMDGLRPIAGLMTMLALAAAAALQGRNRPLAVPCWLLAGGIVASLYGLFQSAGLDPFYLDNPNQEAVSTLGNTNELAEVAALLIPIALSLVLVPGRASPAAGLAALTMLVAALWVSGGRGGVLAALAGMLVFLALVFKSARARRPAAKDPAPPNGAPQAPSWRRPVLLAAGLCAGLLLGAVFGSERSLALKNIETEASIFSPDYPTNKVRIEIWKGTLSMIKDHPLLGVGAGRFRMAYPPYRSPEEVNIPGLMGAMTEVHDPHNEFLWAAAAGGLPLAAVFAIFIAWLIQRSAAAAWSPASAAEGYLAAGRAGTAAAFAVLCLVRSPLHNPAAAAILFLVLGLVMAQHPGSASRPAGGRAPSRAGRLASAALVAFTGLCLWLGGTGFASDWLAASASITDPADFGPDEFQTLKRAADLDPGNIDIANFVGQIAATSLMGTAADEDGRYKEEARRRLGHVLDRHPYHPGALKAMARIEALDGDLDAALDLMTRYLAVRMEPASPVIAVVELLEKEGRFREAAEWILERREADPRILIDRASALFEEGRIEAAALYADQYLSARPLDGDALYLLGKCLASLADGGEKEVYRRMHLAYALEWIEKEDWAQAKRSIQASRRYGEGEGEAALLAAIVEAAGGAAFEPPPESRIRNQAFIERLKALAAEGKLPKEAAERIRGM